MSAGVGAAEDYFGLDPAAARTLVERARAGRITVLVDIANWNNCAVTAQSDEWFRL